MTTIASSIEAIEGRIYDAALSPELWPAALEGLAGLVGSASATFMAADPAHPHRGFIAAWGLDRPALSHYQQFTVRDDAILRLVLARPAGSAMRTVDLIDDDALERSDFYQTWLRPHDIFYGMVAALRRPEPVMVAVQRPQRRGAHTGVELARFSALMPHFQRALRISDAIGGYELASAAALEALDRTVHGVILLDRSGAIVHMNRTASQIAAEGDGLSARRRRLQASLPVDLARLSRAIDHTCGSADGHAGSAILTIERSPPRRPLVVMIVALNRFRRERFGLGEDGAAAIVLVNDPERQGGGMDALLARLYGLTPAESRIADAIASGFGVEEISRRMAISRGAVRFHLKSVFLKTRTSRQAELTHMLMAGPAGFNCRDLADWPPQARPLDA